MSTIDLKTLPPDLQATLSKKETDGERRLRLIKDSVVFTFAVILLIIAAYWSLKTMSDPTADADNKHTAQTIITAIVGGLIGYLLKK